MGRLLPQRLLHLRLLIKMRTLTELRATLDDFDAKLSKYESALSSAVSTHVMRRPSAVEELRKELNVTWGEIGPDVRALGAPLMFEIGKLPFATFENALRPQSRSSVASTTLTALQFARHAIEIARGRAQRLATGGPSPVASARGQAAAPPHSKKVFVVHGHDSAQLGEVSAFISSLGLEPVILKDKPQGGRTLIEKFEDYADVSYAVVLLTPDDVGRPMLLNDGPLSPRARQNVVLEWGFFMGKRGRERIAVMYKSGVEKPSDIDGIAYIPADDEGWKLRLAQELQHAGFSVKLA